MYNCYTFEPVRNLYDYESKLINAATNSTQVESYCKGETLEMTKVK
jgi:hypothetical protein